MGRSISVVASKRPAIAPLLSQFLDCRQAPLEEPALRLRLRQFERSLVGGAGLLGAAEPSQEICPRRVEVVVAVQLETVDEVERFSRAACLADRDRAVELDNWRAGQRGELVVQRGDLAPVRGLAGV